MWTWTWNFVSHMHNCTCIIEWRDILSLPQYISPATELKKNLWVMGQHLVTHDPCDPSDFRDPFDPWPMTHRPIPCSAPKFRVNLAQTRSAVPEIFHTQTKKSQTAPKQNFTQFTVCGKHCENKLSYLHTLAHQFIQATSLNERNAFPVAFQVL